MNEHWRGQSDSWLRQEPSGVGWWGRFCLWVKLTRAIYGDRTHSRKTAAQFKVPNIHGSSNRPEGRLIMYKRQINLRNSNAAPKLRGSTQGDDDYDNDLMCR